MSQAADKPIKKSVDSKPAISYGALPRLFERAWTCAPPGQQAAVRNAILRALVNGKGITHE